MKLKFSALLVCVLLLLLLNVFSPNHAAAQSISATLNDSFADPDGDGKAKAGDEITYTTITNSGATEATNVTLNTPVDANSTLTANSVVVSAMNQYAIRCTGSTAGDLDCGTSTPALAAAAPAYRRIIGGQYSNIVLNTSNVVYNAAANSFSFDATLTNLLNNSLGTIDGVNAVGGVDLFVQNFVTTSGTGTLSAANADGTGTFTAANQPFFNYNVLLRQNDTTAVKNLQFSVPNTVGTFTVEFLVSAAAEQRLVINEVLANPGGTISDANGEWFEIYNAGSFPIDMKNFLINDTSTSGMRPSHTIASSVLVQPGGYATFGNTKDTTLNGGVPVDYAYGGALALANSTDLVRVQVVNPADPATPLTIDQTVYNSAAISAQNGISRELKNPALDNSNMDNSNWSDASVNSVYGPGGRGTPKAQNGGFTPFSADRFEIASFEKVFGKEADAEKNEGKSAGKNSIKNLAQRRLMAGETVSVVIGTIPAGGTATVSYKVVIANPLPAGTTQISSQGTVSGDGFSIATDDPAATGAADPTITPIASFGPTAAPVTLGGRAVAFDGRGIANVVVTLTAQNGANRTARTNAFGYYRFSEVAAGETCLLTASAKSYTFSQPTQILNAAADTGDINFVAAPR